MIDRHGIALVIADTAGRFPLVLHDAADFVYVRLHGSTELYRSRYADREIHEWARRVRRWISQGKDVYVFFDNTDKLHAPTDALRLLDAIGHAGANVTGARATSRTRPAADVATRAAIPRTTAGPSACSMRGAE